MLKKEWVYREIAALHLQEKGARFTELSLSKKFKISLSTVHNAIFPLAQNGIIQPLARGWRLVSFGKLLSFWATNRRLKRDIIWRARAQSAQDAERAMPSGAIWGGCSAYRFRYMETPSDYSTVIAYCADGALPEMKKRLAGKGGTEVLVLKQDPFLKNYSKGGICPDPQIYVDLWNQGGWQSAYFLRSLAKRMGLDETILE